MVAEGGLATSVQVLRDLCGADWAPSEVLIPRRAPANPEPYRACFRAPVRFDQETAALVFPSTLLARRLPDANPLLRRAFEERLLEIERACPTDLVDELRRMLRTELSRRRASATDVAQHYSVHGRTMNRHLKAAGTSFRAVANGVRFEIARQLIADTDIPLAQISAMLDFSEPAAFTRAFHRWSDVTPSDYRTKHKPTQCESPSAGAQLRSDLHPGRKHCNSADSLERTACHSRVMSSSRHNSPAAASICSYV